MSIHIQSPSTAYASGTARQRGVVLFFALIALVAMSLAAVALIRSVDTSTIIAGNLAFKQSATRAGDGGIEAAITWMATVQAASTTLNVLNDPTHPFNNDDPASGYYSSLDEAFDLSDEDNWTDANSVLVGTDQSGNEIRYIIQRVCRNANQPVQSASCLFAGVPEVKDGQHVKPPQEFCDGTGCPPAGQTPQNRITARSVGPRNSVSYVQAFVY